MRLFVTGATGFIGSHAVNHAMALGHDVLALRRSPISQPRIALTGMPEWLDKRMDEVTEADLRSIDVVLHLAAHSTGFPNDSLLSCLSYNLMAPLALFEQARTAGITRYVVTGSCFEYGKSAEYYDFIPVLAPLEPTHPYSASKAAASIAFIQWASEFKLSMIIQRPFHVFGEGESEERLWPSLLKAAKEGVDFSMTEGNQIRDFIEVGKVAACLIKTCEFLAELQSPLIQVKNLGSGKPTSIRSFAETWWRRWGATGSLRFGVLPYRAGEVMRYVPLIEDIVLHP
jgi:nucleoside-diphosphate-sugar epimerase